MIDGFVPAVGDVFEVLTAGVVTGVFDTVTLTGFPPDLVMLATYSANSVQLEAVSTNLADCDGNGTVDEFDFQCLVDCHTGPGGVLAPGCESADLDGDGDVDLVDFGIFQILYAS